jgi:Transcriptional regulator, AbiEi antitoxin
VTAAEATLAAVRRLVPETWEPAAGDAARLAEIRDVLYPRAKVRARIVALVAEHGALRMTQIRDMLGLSGGSASGHLSALVEQGRLERPGGARGVYIIPGRMPAELPPHPTAGVAGGRARAAQRAGARS